MSAEGAVDVDDLMARLAALVASRVPAPTADDVRAVSAGYTTDRDQIADLSRGEAAYAARAHFFLPRDAAKVAKPLAELAAAGVLPAGRTWRVLDLGAGLGSTTLGAALAGAALTGGGLDALEVDAVESDAGALAVFRRLAQAAPEHGAPTLRLRGAGEARDIRAPVSSGPYDLILAGLVLNELGESVESLAARLRAWTGLLAPGGALIAIEPALREPTRQLHAVRDALLSSDEGAPLHVFAPCVTPDPCPMRADPRGWCHEDIPARLPEASSELARAAGLRFERLTFSYLTLRREPGDAAGALRADGGLAPSERAYRVVSQPLTSKGKVERRLCGAGGMLPLRRLDRQRTDVNAWVSECRRGEVVAFDPGDASPPKALRVSPELRARRLRVLGGAASISDE